MKEKALWLYQRLTRERRDKLYDSWRREGCVPIAILFYHRVANRHPNPWTLSHRDFARHLNWLQESYDIVSLEEAQRRIRSNFCERPTVSLTFDDGYAENAEFAIPELVRRNLPATYFVATEFVRTGNCFPHDAQAGQPLPPNTIDDLRDFDSQGIEIGAHTRTHADLGKMQRPQDLRREIAGSAGDLEEWLGRKIRYFAFPFGLPVNTTQAAVDEVAEAGFEAFCTAYGAWNWPGSVGFHLRRIHADPGLEKLKNWLTYDVRKLADHPGLPFIEPAIHQTGGVPSLV